VREGEECEFNGDEGGRPHGGSVVASRKGAQTTLFAKGRPILRQVPEADVRNDSVSCRHVPI
jgi:hypothetical protein